MRSLLLWLTMIATGTSEGLKIFEAPDLSTAVGISVKVCSSIPADIRWKITENGVFTIEVNDEHLGKKQNERINFTFASNSTHVSLLVSEINNQQVALVTGSGSRAILNTGQIFILIWLSALTGNWKHIFIISAVVIGSFMAQVVGQTFAEGSYNTNRRRLVINILVPRRLRFHNVSLVSHAGSIWYNGSDGLSSIECHTGVQEEQMSLPSGCTKCCYGRGVCINNTCHCDDGYDTSSSCETKKRQNVIYTHPLDPRLLYSKLTTGDEAYVYFTHDSEQGTIKIKMAVKKTSGKRLFLIDFDRYGRIKRVNQNNSQNETSFVMMIARGCQIRIFNKTTRGRKYLLKNTNICQSNSTPWNVQQIVPHQFATYQSKLENLQNLLYGIIKAGQNGTLLRDKYIKVWMDVKSCGKETSSGALTVNLESVIYNVNSSERINIPVFRAESGEFSFSLPNITLKFTEEYEEKCGTASSIGQYICSATPLGGVHDACSDLSTNDSSRKTCLNFLRSFEKFCEFFTANSLINQTDCISFYDERRDFFSGDELIMKPVVTFEGGKVINNLHRRLSLQNISLLGGHNITIVDDKPDFRITGVTVTPPDPLPLDLYQVRVDYACATNYTLIDMRIRGSDFYTNYATCSGISNCNCCVLHAAGAPGSVVDNIVINVTDSWTGTNISHTVVVVF